MTYGVNPKGEGQAIQVCPLALAQAGSFQYTTTPWTTYAMNKYATYQQRAQWYLGSDRAQQGNTFWKKQGLNIAAVKRPSRVVAVADAAWNSQWSGGFFNFIESSNDNIPLGAAAKSTVGYWHHSRGVTSVDTYNAYCRTGVGSANGLMLDFHVESFRPFELGTDDVKHAGPRLRLTLCADNGQ